MSPVGRPNGRISYEAPNKKPPNFTPMIEKALAQGTTLVPGTEFILPSSLDHCLFQFTYIWLKNGREFWTKPVLRDENIVRCWIWNNQSWEWKQVSLHEIYSFLCY